MTPIQIELVAQHLREAARSGKYLEPIRETWPDATIAHAYAIQDANTEYKTRQGRRIVGRKIGLTSVAVQKQLSVDRPDYGVLFDDMSFGDCETIPVSALAQPKIEAEVAFVLGRDLDIENPTAADLINAIEYALPALEIVGSRIENWNIGIIDTIADNASSSAFVLGTQPKKLDVLDLRLCGMVLEKKGDPVSVGAGAACLGHPLNAVTWLARKMVSHGAPLRAGDIVLSGALGPMAAVSPGERFECRIEGLGTVRAVFEKELEAARS
ncbi:2-keto-4-pentenoate hydratase [Paraburkholderia sp. J63]|uniref:2-keto-4-pentenoate hydratase n=1 Tax=Paraburkholderia sp. J63 TaxID=2805434 RepID=UPI002ABD3AA6|nr:fumarylacetoacetate hydrolase family protein [Paraburkholderia sp. J63]